jgi:hypothetical protein
MWRQLLARCHPDAGGNEELFVWATALRNAVLGAAREAQDVARVPYPEDADFGAVTARAVSTAGRVEDVHGELLLLLADCRTVAHADREARRGATYQKLALIAYAVGMTSEERSRWYRVAEGVPLSERHTAHILAKLRKKGPDS